MWMPFANSMRATGHNQDNIYVCVGSLCTVCIEMKDYVKVLYQQLKKSFIRS